MTNTTVSPTTPHRLRSAFAQILSDFAVEKGIKPVASPVVSTKTRGTKRHPKEAAPGLVWVDRGRTMWEFHIMPGRRAAGSLSPGLKSHGKTIICRDSAGNLGVIDPVRLLGFLEENREESWAAPDRATLRSFRGEIEPAPALPRCYHFKGIVTKNHQFLRDHFSLRIRTGPLPETIPGPTPGQFLQLLCDPAAHAESPEYRTHSYGGKGLPKLLGRELLEKRPFLRRPFSIASHGPALKRDDLKDAHRLGAGWFDLIDWLESEFEVIYRREPDGPGTGALAAYGVGEEIDVVGPMGKGFNLVPPLETALLVGGGIGATPMLFLAEALRKRDVKTNIFIGAVNKSRIPFRLLAHGSAKHRIARFDRLGAQTTICTDDASAGRRGLVTDPLVRYLEKSKKAAENVKIFACGPRPMLAALEGIATRYGVPCEALLEERMACGFGACISCVCGVKEAGGETRYTRICTEGPAFDMKKVMWHA